MDPAQDALFHEYAGLARAAAGAVCRRWPAWRDRWDELHAAALVGVWEAARSYDPARSTSPRHWIALRARGAAIDWIRHCDQDARCQTPAPPTVSWDALEYEPCRERPRVHGAAELVEELLEELLPSQVRLARWLLAGRTQQDYADVLGVTPCRVSQLVAELRRTLIERRAELAGAAQP